MSQLKFIIIFSLAMALILTEVQSKRNQQGCASFGHSCYGGFGKKRSDPSLNLIDASQTEESEPMKVFPFPSPPPTQQQQKLTDQREKEIKFIILSTINQVVEETLKKITDDYEK